MGTYRDVPLFDLGVVVVGITATIEDIPVKARTADPLTSHVAAAALQADTRLRGESVEIVVRLLDRHGPMTDLELAPLFLIEKQRCSPHLHRMARKWGRELGLVRDTGDRRTNSTTKRAGIVWGLGRDLAHLAAEFETCAYCGHTSRNTQNM